MDDLTKQLLEGEGDRPPPPETGGMKPLIDFVDITESALYVLNLIIDKLGDGPVQLMYVKDLWEEPIYDDYIDDYIVIFRPGTSLVDVRNAWQELPF